MEKIPENQPNKREILKGLTPGEEKIWDEINASLDSYVDDLVADKISIETLRKSQNEIIDFKEKSEEKGIDLYQYILWHRLIGSTVPEGLRLDTEDHIVENFIRQLYSNY